jgi:broad specificity phosphatase PhoE
MIVVVRHGRTEQNRRGVLLGHADPALDATGRDQAAALAAAIPAMFDGRVPVAVVASPLRRTMETAAAIAAPLGLSVERDSRLIEMDYGEWDEQPLADLAPDVWVQWREDPDFRAPGGESLAEVQARVGECAADLLERAADGVVIAVSHVSPIKAAVVWALGGEAMLAWRLRVDVASITRIAQGPAGPVLVGFNHPVR